MELLLTQTLNGLVYGVTLFLLAAGLTLIFGLMGVVNLAHGSFFMIGGFIAMSIVKWTGSFWWALVATVVICACVSALLILMLWRSNHFYFAIATLAQLLMLEGRP